MGRLGRWTLVLLLVAGGCGGGDDAGEDGGDGGGDDGGDDGGDGVPPPEAECEAVALVDTSAPDRVVGEGDAAGCTEEALAEALEGGGVIVFDCGEEAATIQVSAALAVTSDVVIDGGGKVALSGGGATRILEVRSAFDQATPSVTVQRMRFEGGNSPDTGDDTEVGGGAIYKGGGTLTVIDSTFVDNHAPATGLDVAGGAIYGFGGGPIVISGSVFSGNSASDGGAVGSLQTDLTAVNSAFSDNAATGTGGNPGDGGAGGAIYLDGTDQTTSLCGVIVRDNRAGAIGGGLFRVSNSEDGALAVERSTVSGNRIPVDAESSLAGGMYLQGLAIEIRDSTVADNEAGYCGGVWLGQGSTVEMVNSTIAGNRALEFHGAGLWLAGSPSGTILNCTIAGNGSTGEEGLAAAIFGEGPDLVLKNTIIDGHAVGNPYSAISCDHAHGDGGGNVQWPVQREAGGSDDPDALCAAGALVADPRLGPLAENGGPTPTAAPAADSPTIGLGTDCPETDQRGAPRAEPCTSGAVEVE